MSTWTNRWIDRAVRDEKSEGNDDTLIRRATTDFVLRALEHHDGRLSEMVYAEAARCPPRNPKSIWHLRPPTAPPVAEGEPEEMDEEPTGEPAAPEDEGVPDEEEMPDETPEYHSQEGFDREDISLGDERVMTDQYMRTLFNSNIRSAIGKQLDDVQSTIIRLLPAMGDDVIVGPSVRRMHATAILYLAESAVKLFATRRQRTKALKVDSTLQRTTVYYIDRLVKALGRRTGAHVTPQDLMDSTGSWSSISRASIMYAANQCTIRQVREICLIASRKTAEAAATKEFRNEFAAYVALRESQDLTDLYADLPDGTAFDDAATEPKGGGAAASVERP